jgi:hypothetical protein
MCSCPSAEEVLMAMILPDDPRLPPDPQGEHVTESGDE